MMWCPGGLWERNRRRRRDKAVSEALGEKDLRNRRDGVRERSQRTKQKE